MEKLPHLLTERYVLFNACFIRTVSNMMSELWLRDNVTSIKWTGWHGFSSPVLKKINDIFHVFTLHIAVKNSPNVLRWSLGPVAAGSETYHIGPYHLMTAGTMAMAVSAKPLGPAVPCQNTEAHGHHDHALILTSAGSAPNNIYIQKSCLALVPLKYNEVKAKVTVP